MPDYTPVYGRPTRLTYTAAATITGGDLLRFSNPDTVVQAEINCTNYVGVAAHDATAGQPVTVYTGAGLIHETKAAAATSIGSLVYAGSSTSGELGTGNVAFTLPIGVAVRSTSGAHQVLRWKSLVG